MNALADAWSKRNYAFALVYVMEAHAVDEWPVAMCEKDFEQHRTFADRGRNPRAPDALLAFPFAYTRCFLGAVRNEFFPVRRLDAQAPSHQVPESGRWLSEAAS